MLFWSWIATHNHLHSTVLLEWLSFGKIDGFVISQNDCWVRCIPQIVCALKKCLVKSQRFFWLDGHLEFFKWEDFWWKRPWGVFFCVLTVFSRLDYLQSWGPSRRFWRLHPPLGQVASLDWLVSTLVGEHHWALFWLNEKILSILFWCWLAPQLWAICRLGWAFHASWGYKFCNISQIQSSTRALFSIWGNLVCLEKCGFSGLVVRFLQVKLFLLAVQLVWLQIRTSL